MNRRGTYFERLVAYPLPDGHEFNQLHDVLEKLRSAARHGIRNRNQFELSTFRPDRDRYPVGFPCLSHVSITLRDGVLDATALYRNQYFLERAYGNYLGLGQVIRFLATESGFVAGELLCVASHAKMEVGTYGRAQVQALIEDCQALVGGAS
jgi:thymidylate synthase